MYIEKLTDVSSIKQLNIKELNCLCDEIRNVIIDTVSNNGGHLSSNLGVVELTVALFYVFDFPKDKVIFDVGHQSYAYKILSGRLNEISSIRKENGLSGYPDVNESEFDSFSVGHAGTALSASLGYAYSRDINNNDYFIINIIGDASFFNGENLEAVSSNASKPNKFITILNDNGMSINKNNNGLYKLVSKITITKQYNKFNRFMSKVFGGWFLGKLLKKIKRSFKRSISKNSFLDYLGLKYVGLFDGHDLKTLIKVLKDIKENKNPTLLHVKTIKGKGYTLAEENSTKFHGVGKNLKYNNNYFSNQVSDILEDLYKDNDKIVAITAGMEDGTGLSKFAKLHPKAFVDVGIQEEFAVTLSAGMAISGTKPIVFIYSTFLQRSYDQIISDVCLQNLPVIFCIDRAGFVGSDGKTHQGLFDVSYLSHIPNLTILSPKDVTELRDMLKLALSLNSPVAIRYPNGEGYEFETKSQIDNSFKWETICEGEKNVIFAVGPRMLNFALEVSKNAPNPVTVVNARCIKPLCSETLNKYSNYRIITLEENTEIGGFGSQVLKYYNDNNLKVDVKIFGVKDCFIEHATIKRQMELNGFTVDNIIKNLL